MTARSERTPVELAARPIRVQARWLAYCGVTDPGELADFERLYWPLDQFLRSVGPRHDGAGDARDLVNDILEQGQELVERLSQLLAPSDDDLEWMDVA